jgi:hypothetical protein
MSHVNKDDWSTVQLFVNWNDVLDCLRFLFLKKECNIFIAVNVFDISVTVQNFLQFIFYNFSFVKADSTKFCYVNLLDFCYLFQLIAVITDGIAVVMFCNNSREYVNWWPPGLRKEESLYVFYYVSPTF